MPDTFAFVRSPPARSSHRCARVAALSDPYCVIQVADPPQMYKTSTVKNTVNPFWDEHFTLWATPSALHPPSPPRIAASPLNNTKIIKKKKKLKKILIKK